MSDTTKTGMKPIAEHISPCTKVSTESGMLVIFQHGEWVCLAQDEARQLLKLLQEVLGE